MADAMSDYLEEQIMKYTFGSSVTYGGFSTVYMSLHISDSTSTNEDDVDETSEANGTEVNATSYSRQSIDSFTYEGETSGVYIVSNSNKISFGNAGEDWNTNQNGNTGDISHVGLYDQSGTGSGNLLWYGVLDATEDINENDEFVMPANALELGLE